jgi:hypothetical protein
VIDHRIVCFAAVILDPAGSAAVGRARYGAIAQLAEHRLCKAGVRGSSPRGSTHKTARQLAGASKVGWSDARSPGT